jgi:hypothetical protein
VCLQLVFFTYAALDLLLELEFQKNLLFTSGPSPCSPLVFPTPISRQSTSNSGPSSFSIQLFLLFLVQVQHLDSLGKTFPLWWFLFVEIVHTGPPDDLRCNWIGRLRTNFSSSQPRSYSLFRWPRRQYGASLKTRRQRQYS